MSLRSSPRRLSSLLLLPWILSLASTSIASVQTPMYPTEGEAVKGEYLVIFEDPYTARRKASEMTAQMGVEVLQVFDQVIAGAHVRMSGDQLDLAMQMPGVRWIEENAVVRRLAPIEQSAPGNVGLDRIDQRDAGLDGVYRTGTSGQGVTIYVIDAGINASHVEFEGRATVGLDLIGDGRNGADCDGHGTHVAGIAASREYGVAKDARIVAIRVFPCTGGSSTGTIVSALDWVIRNGVRPGVVNMSLGGPPSRALDQAVDSVVAAGLFVAVAAGNESQNACGSSPAGAPSAFAVGASRIDDRRASFSNFGSCVRLFAPGEEIVSTWFTSRGAVQTLSGTSMSSPHVAGAAALLLEESPRLSPSEVGSRLLERATPNVVGSPGQGSPNLLLFVAGSSSEPPPDVGEGGLPISEDFESGAGDFRLRRDVFGTGVSRYTSGSVVSDGGSGDSRALGLRLGGIDSATVFDMSAGYELTFELSTRTRVRLDLQYSVTQSAAYERGEISLAFVALDDQVIDSFGEVDGDGNGGIERTTGLRSRSISLGTLSPGTHTLLLGGFNVQKSFQDELTEVVFDDVRLSAE